MPKGICRRIDPDGSIYEGQIARYSDGTPDTEYEGFGRKIDAEGKYYYAGWHHQGVLHGFARKYILEDRQGTYNPPKVEEGFFRNGRLA